MMQSSFGESDLIVNGRIAGRVRVLDVYHGTAVYPRLTFRFGVSLLEHPDDSFAPDRPIKDYQLRNLSGELRLEENGRAIGLYMWNGPRQHVRSSPNLFENQIEAVADLDWGRVETIEESRAGNESVLWLAMWPTLVDEVGFLDCEMRPICAHVPRHRWIELLTQLTGVRRSLLEIVLPSVQSAEFNGAVGHVEEARVRIDGGDFDEAVAACRRAIESLFRSLSMQNNAKALEERLVGITDAQRAKAYASIVSRIKEFGNLTIHRAEAPSRYMRAEAQFVVAVTSHILALLGSMLGKRAD